MKLPPLQSIDKDGRRYFWKCSGCGISRLLRSLESAEVHAFTHAEEFPCDAVLATGHEPGATRANEEVTVSISGTAALAVQIDEVPWNKYDWKRIARGKGCSYRCQMPRAEAIAFANMCIENAANSGWDPEIAEAWRWAGRNGQRILDELGVTS